ncbi:protein-export chaperone SecB [Luteimonas huabeiensis]|uniref:protein-export chaperone SecB n=1 Tax=Luteimonas huabeiensis TaxID=1244513 RepID=UPI0004631CA7|nr:protein-export chaperone SecB [Luteimonas huabeiensis]
MSDQQPANGNGAATPAQANGPQFTVEKIYVRDVSFESPKAPQIFNEQAQPQLNMSLNQRVQRVGENAYEVVLQITLTCTLGEGNTVYVAEVQQAGVFGLIGFEANVLDAMLGTQCPNVLYPYARQLLGELIQAGGFPPFLLQPINFDALYAEGLRQRAAQGQGESNETVGNA